MNKPLSLTSFRHKLPNAYFFKYGDLARMTGIDKFVTKKPIVILYPGESDMNGHWIGVFMTVDENGKKIVEVYDPYGFKIDDTLKYSDVKYPPYLAQLLYHSKYKIQFNNGRIQKWNDNVATCGRHVLNRINNRDIPLDLYNNMMLNNGLGLTPDQYVLLLNP
jgi:hypothetical protein